MCFLQPLLISSRNPKTPRSSSMTRWCGSAKPRGSQSLLTGGWKMEKTWNLQRWEIRGHSSPPKVRLQTAADSSRRVRATERCTFSLFLQALPTNKHPLLSSWLRRIRFKGDWTALLGWEYFTLLWKPQWCKGYPNILLNLFLPSAVIKSCATKCGKSKFLYINTGHPTFLPRCLSSLNSHYVFNEERWACRWRRPAYLCIEL